MKIARVFPTKTSYSPSDPDAYFGPPDLFTPHYDEVHVSVTFTWDRLKAEQLADDWRRIAPVKIGGVGLSPSGTFTPGVYVRPGITFTSRGCPNRCPFCFVPEYEGKLKEIPIVPGNVIQDNNFLACSEAHKQKVYQMLRKQHLIEFKGGLEARRIDAKTVDEFRSLRIMGLWLACDSRGALKPFERAVTLLRQAGFKQRKIMAYVLIGDDREENENRLREVYRIGAYPFAQLYQPKEAKIEYSREWKMFARLWSRPAAYKSMLKRETALLASRGV